MRPHELRQGPAGPGRARLPRRLAGPLPRCPGRRAARDERSSSPSGRSRLAPGDEVEALVCTERSGLARFAASEIHQPTLIDERDVQLRRGARRPRGLGLDEPARRRRPRRARPGERRRRPRARRVDPTPPARAARRLPEVEGFDEETAALSPAEQARLARGGDRCAPAVGLYGYFTSGVTELAVASTTGLRASQRVTDATCLVLAAGDGASGYAAATAGARARSTPPRSPARRPRRPADEGARRAEPGSYRAVLEPYALAELLDYFACDAFNGLGLIEERSFFAGRIGERVVRREVSIADDALDPRGLPKAFDFEGTPKRRVDARRARGRPRRRYGTARRPRAGAGLESTGHALPPRAARLRGPSRRARWRRARPGRRTSWPSVVGDGIWVTRAALPQRRRPARGHHHRHDARRHLPRPRRQGRRAARQPALHGRSVPDAARGRPRRSSRERTLVNRSEFYGDALRPSAWSRPALASRDRVPQTAHNGSGVRLRSRGPCEWAKPAAEA